jgi:hypothetical protein
MYTLVFETFKRVSSNKYTQMPLLQGLTIQAFAVIQEDIANAPPGTYTGTIQFRIGIE